MEERPEITEYEKLYRSETFDLRRFMLLLTKRLPVLLLFFVLGTVLFAGGYGLWYLKEDAAAKYRCSAFYEIGFDTDTASEVQLYYNDYTWNDVIDTDRIAGRAAELSGIDKKTIAGATTVPTMSDIRMIWVYADAAEAETAEAIQEAIGQALQEFGEQTEGFLWIRRWDYEPAVLQRPANLLLRWSILGAVLGLLTGGLFVLYGSAENDRIYLEEDLERRLGILSAGVILSGTEAEKLREKTEKELRDNLKQAVGGYGTLSLMTVDEDMREGEEAKNFLRKILPDKELCNEGAEAVILCIPWEKTTGRGVYRVWKDLRVSGKTVAAVILTGVAPAFYAAYYFDRRQRKG